MIGPRRLPVAGCWIGIGRSPSLIEAADAAEPSSTLVAAALRATLGYRVVVRVEDRNGALLGAVVLHRLGPAQWDALPLIVEPRSVQALARVIDRSPASAVLGIGRHVAPLVEHLSRARSVGRSPFFGSVDANTVAPADLDPRTRTATLADVDALAALFDGTYPLSRPPDQPSWRRAIRQAIVDGFVIVAEVDARVVGGILCGPTSGAWAFGTDTVVAGDRRGEGLSWAMTNRMFALVTASGLMMCGAKIDENPMDVDRHYADHGAVNGELWGVALQEHLRTPSVRWRRRQLRRIRRRSAALRTTVRSVWEQRDRR